jgi:hypothetical protein
MQPASPSLRRLPVALLAFTLPAAAQCGQWVGGEGQRGIVGNVHIAMTWDPDGAGPAPARLVVGGNFAQAGNASASCIAAYDPATRSWSPLGSGTNGEVFALAVLPNGDLVAGGDFFVAGGQFASAIARWNGTTWSPLGAGFDNRVDALAVLPNGDLVAGGYFSNSGGVPMARVARWNGTAWSAMGAGMGSAVFALAAAPNGDVFAGGDFGTADNGPAAHVARWNGANWSALGTGTNGQVLALAVLADGSLVAGGSFGNAGGIAADSIARWDGAAWQSLGTGCPGGVRSLCAEAGGGVVVGGNFSFAGGVAASRIARWDGTTWSAFGAGLGMLNGTVFALVSAIGVLPGGDLAAFGTFDAAGGRRVQNAARWNGTEWSPTNDGLLANPGVPISALVFGDGDDLFVGGSFIGIGGVDTSCVARWDGAHWTALGSGLGASLYHDNIQAMVRMPNGDIVAGGYTRSPTGFEAPGPWRWDGTSWSQVGGGIAGPIYSMVVLPNGDLVIASGNSLLRRWNGVQWSSIGTGLAGTILSLLVEANGDLIVGGQLTLSGSQANVVRWNGVSFVPMANGLPTRVTAMARLANGDLVAGTDFSAVLRWTGASWLPISPASNLNTFTMIALPDGDLAVSLYDPAIARDELRRWDGVSWSNMATPGAQVDFVQPMALIPSGGLAVAGRLTTSAGAFALGVSRYVSTCPATAIANGSGCAGNSGTPAYAVTALPWLGSTYRARGTNLPPLAIAVGVTGFGAPVSLPLPGELLPSSPACVVFAAPDLLRFSVVAAATVDTAIAVPNNSNLLGLTATDQLVVLEYDAGANLLQSTTSNALLLTVGTY